MCCMSDFYFFCVECGGKMRKVGKCLYDEICNKCYLDSLIEMNNEQGIYSFYVLREKGIMFGKEWDCEGVAIERHEIKGMEVRLFA